MCGIIGHIRVNGENSTDVCVEGLKTLQYRGYDSVGIAGMYQGKIEYFKRVGKVHELAKFKKPLDYAIGHTRWATHGGLTEENAHPHFNEDKSLFLVHNGIIENYGKLRADLEKEGVTFVSQTDSEVVAHLVSKHFTGSLMNAALKVIPMLEGTFAIAMIHRDDPGRIVATRRDAPMILGTCRETKDRFLASDANAFGQHPLDIIYLEDDEIAELSYEHILVKNKFGVEVIKKSQSLVIQSSCLDKAGCDHFLLKEILEQPQALKRAIKERIDTKSMTAHFKELNIPDRIFASCDHISILACGSSYHAGSIAKQMIETHTRKHVSVEIASEYRYANPILTKNSLVIAISQSGETADTIAALQLAKSKTENVIALCNVETSTIARMVENTISLRAGPEISVCSTKAFTSQLITLYLLSLKMGRINNLSRDDGKIFTEELQKMITSLEEVLKQEKHIEKIAQKASIFEHAFFIGRQQMYPTSLEAALKLKEISYIHALGIAAGELKHGTIALITPKALTIALCGNTQTLEKLHSNITEITARDGPIFAFANQGDEQIKQVADEVIFLPKLCDLFSPFIYSAATQLFAYHVAKKRKCDIDQPRNLAKSVTVE